MQTYFTAVETMAAKFGLYLSRKKTTLLSLYSDNQTELLYLNHTAVGEVTELTDHKSLKYLGTVMTLVE